MQVAGPRLAAGRPVRPLANPPLASRKGSMIPWSAAQGPSAPGPGDKLIPMIRTPLDLVALPGRVALGTLQSLSEILEKFPADVERLQLLANDPRSMEEKQAEVLGELEDRVCSYLQKGTDAEAEVLESVMAAIPEPLKDVLPEPLKDVLKPRSSTDDAAGTNDNGSGSNGAAVARPLASWTITSEDETVVVLEEEEEKLPPMTPAAIAASQTASEVMEVNAAVAAVHKQLSELQTNKDPSRENMIRLNLREAEELLGRRLEQMSPSHRAIGDAIVQVAISEAEALLTEVRALHV